MQTDRIHAPRRFNDLGLAHAVALESKPMDILVYHSRHCMHPCLLAAFIHRSDFGDIGDTVIILAWYVAFDLPHLDLYRA